MRKKIEFEYIKCNICGKDDSKHLFTVEDKQSGSFKKFSIVKCKNCSLVYISPRPKKHEIGRFYLEKYFSPTAYSGTELEQMLWYFLLKLFSRSSRIAFLYIISLLKNKSSSKVLDVGCGYGELLKLLKEDGWKSYGVDTSSTAAKKAREMGLDVFTGELIDAGFLDKYFDVVILHHSLEHMHDPTEVLREVHRILKDNGVLIISVPNIDSIEAKIFQKNWFAIEAPRHLYHFSIHTLDLLLNKIGFIRQTVWFDPTPMTLINSMKQIIENKLPRILTHLVIFIFSIILLPINFILVICHLGALFTVSANKK